MSAQPPLPPLVFDTSDADFETAVLDRSMEVPVLLDCWAPWCGPCKQLTPVLEKIAKASGGRFVLAKLNVDESPQIAAALGARSIPMVTLIAGGRPVGQFTGALPEGKVREFLDRHLGPDTVDAEATEVEPEPTPLDHAEAAVDAGAFDDAQALLRQLPADLSGADAARRDKLLARVKLATAAAPAGDAAALTARIAANAKDFEARFQLAALLVHRGDFKAGFEQLLEVVLRDKAEQREAARKQLVEWFEACPDPDVVSQGRRYLGMYLN